MYTFKKEERLCSHNQIQELLKHGSSFFEFPFRCIWFVADKTEHPVQIAFSVPKRKIKHANKRNYIKRQIRNAYRIEKHTLTERAFTNQKSILCILVYNSSEIFPYKMIEQKIKTIVSRLEEQLFVSLENNKPKT